MGVTSISLQACDFGSDSMSGYYYFSGQWLDSFAYHIDIRILHFIIPVLITLLIILITSGYNALKSTFVNPVDVLKHE